MLAGDTEAMLVFDTELGLCGVRWSDLGITEVVMPGSRQFFDAQPRDAADLPPSVRDGVAGIIALLAGEQRDLCGITLDERGLDPFRAAVYAATREIGPGATATYGEIARAIEAPGAARAVGAALGSNPYPIIVPCHRVLAANGALHGFSAPGGVATKRRMLEIERAPGFTQASLFA
jgi:methylated-DNA-[protein]-cysteine S-methyltransferase